MLQTSTKAASWFDQSKEWIVKLLQKPKAGAEKAITIRSDFLVMVSGIFTSARMPNALGMNKFEGHQFHTSRWDYAYTNGSSANPELTGLQGKRVGIVGTGATAVQVILQEAKWVKELHVFQRTPPAVDNRDQKVTDLQTWKSEIANKAGWQ